MCVDYSCNSLKMEQVFDIATISRLKYRCMYYNNNTQYKKKEEQGEGEGEEVVMGEIVLKQSGMLSAEELKDVIRTHYIREDGKKYELQSLFLYLVEMEKKHLESFLRQHVSETSTTTDWGFLRRLTGGFVDIPLPESIQVFEPLHELIIVFRPLKKCTIGHRTKKKLVLKKKEGESE